LLVRVRDLRLNTSYNTLVNLYTLAILNTELEVNLSGQILRSAYNEDLYILSARGCKRKGGVTDLSGGKWKNWWGVGSGVMSS
jgi:hypothetical protein